jgi:uncharacterized repeat protein (TIGR03803 family)
VIRRRSLTVSALAFALAVATFLSNTRAANAQTQTILYNFCSAGTSCPDGDGPGSGLIADAAGNLYGTTASGGIGLPYGQGTVFELSPHAGGSWSETVLYAFSGGADGGHPSAPLIMDQAGNLYGTAEFGGAYKSGVVFKLSLAGDTWEQTVLYSFTGGSDGSNPRAGLTIDPQGNLYGTSDDCAFELTPSGTSWALQVIYNLGGGTTGGLTRDSAGNIFGVTTFSTVFESSPNGSGGWNTKIIHNFTGAPGDGYYPEGTLVFDKTGSLYGTTTNGGAYNMGTVFKLTPANAGEWPEQILHSFSGSTADGNNLWAGVVLDDAGNIYGTTPFSRQQYTAGTVFELLPQPGGSYNEKILWSFNFTNGAAPFGSVILDNAGNLYGTTSTYGAFNGGNAFRINMSVAPTKTTLSSSLDPSFYGQPVTLTATVNSKLGPPPDGETVTFLAGPNTLGTGTLSAGSASLTTSSFPAGALQLAAVYLGDAQFNVSKSARLTQQIARAASSTTVVSSMNPSNNGQAVTFTSTVVPQFGGTVQGTISFYDGNALLQHAVAVNGGTASLTISTLSVGVHTITARYNGSAGLESSSAALKQTVD